VEAKEAADLAQVEEVAAGEEQKMMLWFELNYLT
jgi:hypothetical protein